MSLSPNAARATQQSSLGTPLTDFSPAVTVKSTGPFMSVGFRYGFDGVPGNFELSDFCNTTAPILLSPPSVKLCEPYKIGRK